MAPCHQAQRVHPIHLVEQPYPAADHGVPNLPLHVLQGCFSTAIRRYEFAGPFRAVFPVKCNHDRRLILNMLEAGRDSGVGLECGSKAVCHGISCILLLPHLHVLPHSAHAVAV